MDKEAAKLRRELSRLETGRGKRYPTELRQRVVAWAQRRHEQGASWETIKAELGQKFDTVRRWCLLARSSRALVPVRGLEPLSGHLFVFLNRRGHVAQMLFWDRSGFCIRVTISLLPDFLASRLTGTLAEVEAAVEAAEVAASHEAALERVRPAAEPDAVTLLAGLRWLRTTPWTRTIGSASC